MPAPSEGAASTSSRTELPFGRGAVIGAVGLFAVAAMLLRIVALDSDPYGRLSWSSALLTDEGFYIHNARNLALYGHLRTDGWNNYLFMPTLHLLQVAVFRTLGTGAVQARMISVACGLLALPVFFAAMNRAFGRLPAAAGTLFLGLDHVNLLFNRMALTDTPTALLLVCGFYAVVRVAQAERGAVATGWSAAGGCALATAVVTRGLVAYVVAAPIAALWPAQKGGDRPRWRAMIACLAAFCACMALYYAAWYAPHKREISTANRYYLYHQLLPKSLPHLLRNVEHAVVGDDRGMAPYLFRHSPVQLLLVLALLLCAPLAGIAGKESAARRYLLGWLLSAWLVYAAVSYSPPRYYVLFYPAMAGLAGIALVELPAIVRRLIASPAARVALSAFGCYHLLESFLHHHSPVTDAVLYAGTSLAAIAAAILPLRRRGRGMRWVARITNHESRITIEGMRWLPALALVAWLLVNGYWTSDWLLHLRYTRRGADRWLAAHMAPSTVLVGDVAPGLCLDNRLMAVNVIPGLCNYDRPLAQFPGKSMAIAILDGRLKERWWKSHYPEEVAPGRRAKLFPRLIRYPVGIYPVSTGAARASRKDS